MNLRRYTHKRRCKVGNFVKYKDIKLYYGLDIFISILNVRKFRHFYGTFKIGSLDLEIQVGRYTNIPREQRLCKLCKADIEDEYHFLLKCPLFNDLRSTYLAPKYTTNPNMHKFVLLMTSKHEQVIFNIATYIYMAYVKRRSLLNEQSSSWYRYVEKFLC